MVACRDKNRTDISLTNLIVNFKYPGVLSDTEYGYG